MSRHLPALAGLAIAMVLTAACGTTVPLSDRSTAGGALVPQQGVTSGAGAPGGTGPAAGLVVSRTTDGVASPVVPTSRRDNGAALPRGASTSVREHEPIEIGFITTSMGNATSLGFNAGQSYPDRATFDALVAEYNAHGGVAGHRIVPVYGETDTASEDWSTQFAAVCATFTQDHHVRAVIGYLFMYLPSFESCLAKASVPHLYAGYQPGDAVDQQQIPTLVGTAHPTVDGTLLTALQGALRSRLLTTSTRLGVMVDDCADGDRAYERTAEPWLKAHRINYRTVVLSCTQGAGDISGMAAAVSNAELQFASAGVDLVFAPGLELLLFMANAESQDYHPDYLGATGGSVVGANAPARQMQRYHGFGWLPSVDVDLRHQPYPQTAAQQACLAKLAKHGLSPSQYNDFMTAYVACDGIDLYANALSQAGSAEPQAVVRGVLTALPSFVGAATYGGVEQAASHQRGGPARYREYGWTDACSCLTYRGGLFPIPNP